MELRHSPLQLGGHRLLLPLPLLGVLDPFELDPFEKDDLVTTPPRAAGTRTSTSSDRTSASLTPSPPSYSAPDPAFSSSSIRSSTSDPSPWKTPSPRGAPPIRRARRLPRDHAGLVAREPGVSVVDPRHDLGPRVHVWSRSVEAGPPDSRFHDSSDRAPGSRFRTLAHVDRRWTLRGDSLPWIRAAPRASSRAPGSLG